MIDINRETGTVTWDGFTLHPHLTHDEFVHRYPAINTVQSHYRLPGIQHKIYQFPKIKFNNYSLTPKLTYVNDNLGAISFAKNDNYSKDQNTLWMDELVKWWKSTQSWLITQLGQPHEIRPADFSDEIESLTSDEIEFFASWIYNFKWGRAGLYYHPLQWVVIRYDYHQQINSWNKLAEECDRRIQKEQERNGVAIAHLQATRTLINILTPHFDFKRVNPSIIYKGIGFSLNNDESSVFIVIHSENRTKKYEICGDNTEKASFIAEGDNSQLIDTLRLFFEAETL